MTVTRVEVQRQSGTTWTTVTRLGAAATKLTVTGLTAGTAYNFRIRLAGRGGNAEPDPVSVPTPPNWPTVSKITGATVALAWRLPRHHPRVTVTGVEVEQSSNSTWATVARLAADATSHAVTGLWARTRYSFRIRLVDTEASKFGLHETVTTLTAEGATGLTASNATLTTVDLAWTHPVQPGGCDRTLVGDSEAIGLLCGLAGAWRVFGRCAALGADSSIAAPASSVPRKMNAQCPPMHGRPPGTQSSIVHT